MTPVIGVFLDASVLFAAAHAPAGGSAAVVDLLKSMVGYRAVASRDVLIEAGRNLANKSGNDAVARF